jgi:hypothetical protein
MSISRLLLIKDAIEKQYGPENTLCSKGIVQKILENFIDKFLPSGVMRSTRRFMISLQKA